MSLTFSTSGSPADFGHHFIVGLSGWQLDDTDKRILEEVRPLGILLLKRNFAHHLPYPAWLEALRKLLDDVRRYCGRNELIVTLDHEGGKVHRAPPPITLFPSPAAYASRAAEVAEAMAREIRCLGVNLSWAPLADIDSNPANPVIGKRAFGRTPEEVSGAAVAYAEALMANGVMACAKHFPGHGDTSADSHLELPYLDLSMAELEERELKPFQALVEAAVPFVMTAHVMFKKVDPDWPATLSERILKGVLRDRWGYEGIVVADDLGMKAVAPRFREMPTAARAIRAGCDMFIVARHPDPVADDFALPVSRFLIEALRADLVSEDELHASFQRIKRVAERMPESEVKLLDEEVLASNTALNASFAMV